MVATNSLKALKKKKKKKKKKKQKPSNSACKIDYSHGGRSGKPICHGHAVNKLQ
jgi:hypothetical protein